MAKTTAQRTDAQPVDTTATETAQVMSAATRKLVDGVRDQFKGFVDGMNILLARRAELAPKFMKAARAYMAEMNANFIDFVRELDPTVPETAKEYRNNPVYNAAVYLKRLTDAQQRAAGFRQVDRRRRHVDAATGHRALQQPGSDRPQHRQPRAGGRWARVGRD